MAISIIPLSEANYPAFYHLSQSTRWGNLMLPATYSPTLWGMVVLRTESVGTSPDSQTTELIGGWAGTLRGNGRLTHLIAKSVYFDAYPVFVSPDMEQQYLPQFLAAIKQYARQCGIVMFNLTHWVRGNCTFPLDEFQDNATFIYDLSNSMDTLYDKLDRLKKRTIKKAENANLEVKFYKGCEAIPHLTAFQSLRVVTQQRAIAHNARSSMLLKSDAFFQKILSELDAYLVAVYWEGRMVAAATFIRGGHTIYGHMAGSDGDANRKTGSGTYYYWKAVEYFQHEGVQYFDFGGCPVQPTETDPAYGVYLFKQGFGGDYIQNRVGRIIISKPRYKILNLMLSRRKLLRFFSRKM